jgi:DNA-directed RNA polymerase specialized sigma24 family protein
MALPLKKRYLDGRNYFRPPAIEAETDEVLAQDGETVIRRAAIQERTSPEYLPSECLVHLIRNARRLDDEATMSLLIPILLRRCESNLRSRVSSELPNAESIREEILGQFSELFAADGAGANPHQLDFFEAHFNKAFQTLRIDIVRREERKTVKHKYVPLPDESQDESDFDETVLKYFKVEPDQESKLVLEQLGKALNALPPDEKEAVVLCHILEYDVESEDPEKRTAATICKVTGRTIRNRLSRAAVRLSSFKERIQ